MATPSKKTTKKLSRHARNRSSNRRRRRENGFVARLKRWLNIASWTLGFAFLLFLILAVYYNIQAEKFDIKLVGQTSPGVKIFDEQGNHTGNLFSNKRHLAKRDDLPDFLVEALLAREDAKFYQHKGVDWKGLARASLRNLKDLKFTQGASTLTMQLAKNTYDIRAKSLHRKFLEIALTRRIEKNYSKDEILTSYLNRIYFGAGAYGIGDAAKRFFSRSVKNLHPGQCAMLVGIIRGPHILNPINNFEAAIRERNQVLNRMVAAGFINEEAANKSRALPIRVQPSRLAQSDNSYHRQAERRHIEELIGYDGLRNFTLNAYSTIDMRIQKSLGDQCRKALTAIEKANTSDAGTLQCAGVTIEPTTGYIRAIVGGRDYQASQHNRALDSKRPIGDLIAPFITAIAIEKNHTPVIGNSIQTGRLVSKNQTISLLERFGFKAPFPKGDDLYRGFSELSPLSLSRALATFAHQGNFPQHILIKHILDTSGNIVFDQPPSAYPLISKRSAQISKKTIKSEKTKLFSLYHTHNKRDLWLVKFAPKLLTLIWVGYDKPESFSVPEKLSELIG